MTHKRGLRGIRYPAPSVPARFRLYHGGAARNGSLATHDRERPLYLGDYVYFSSLKSYAQEYLRRCSHARPSLFVVDARYVPDGTRVILDDNSGWPPRSVEQMLFALHDVVSDLSRWLTFLEDDPARTLLGTAAHAAREPTFVSRLRNSRYLRRSSNEFDSGPVVSPNVLRLLRLYLDRFLTPIEAADCAQLVPLDDDYPCRDCWNSAILFLLDTFSTLELSADQLRSAVRAYRDGWLATFTTPLTAANLEAMRQLGTTALLSDDYLGGAYSGMIIMVPGPIPVLAARHTAGRSGKRRHGARPPSRRDPKA